METFVRLGILMKTFIMPLLLETCFKYSSISKLTCNVLVLYLLDLL